MQSKLMPRLSEWHWVHLGLLVALPAYWLVQRASGLPAVAGLMLWLVINIAVLWLAERITPYRDDWHPSVPDLKRDAGMLSLNVLADGIADVVVVGVAMMAAGALATNHLPLVVQVVGGIAVAEFGSYWPHRWSHEGGWLWRVHVVHHLPEAVNTANSFNAHPINALYNKVARVVPLVLLGVSADAIFVVALFGLTQGMAVHANVRGRLGWLNWIVGSAELHRMHHSHDMAQARNFGTTMPLWDQLFGTFRSPQVVKRVGVLDARSYPRSTDLPALLRWPFARAERPMPNESCCG